VAARLDTVHTAPATEVHPVQPVKSDIALGVAVRSIVPVGASCPEQVPVPGEAQLRSGATPPVLVTVPFPP
jgi:hypothetical protein